MKGVEYLEAAVRQIEECGATGVRALPDSDDSTRSTCSTRLKIISSAFGEEKEKVWDWCDVLVLPTLSENFGLVIAEALERGKRVITTDGAPAWGENLSRVEVERGRWDGRVERVETCRGGEVLFGYSGRLIYLKGYRDGSDEERVELLKKAIDYQISSDFELELRFLKLAYASR